MEALVSLIAIDDLSLLQRMERLEQLVGEFYVHNIGNDIFLDT